jgi:hypothetical protein
MRTDPGPATDSTENNTMQPRRQFLTSPRAALALLALTAAAVAQSEPSPYFIGATLAHARDSNIYRLPAPIGDTYTSAGLVAGLDQPIGRQRVYANANVRNNRFNERNELDNVSYGVTAGLDWSTIERLSGNVSLAVNENLANYGATLTQLAEKNIEKSGQFSARVQYGLASLLSLEGTVSHRRLDYSAPAFANSELTQNAVSVGLKYRPSGALTLGTALRATRGRYPAQGADFDRHDVDLTSVWVATGQSTVNARLSFTKQDNSGTFTQSDFSGATGALGWTWRPTGKLNFTTSLSRDTGAESSFLQLGNGIDPITIGDTSRFTSTLGVTAGYEVTAKIRLGATGRYSHRDLENTLAALKDTDILKSLALTASYAATRNWLLACSAGREVRRAAGLLSSPFAANTASCSAQFVLQ